jgi:hypothetical protein
MWCERVGVATAKGEEGRKEKGEGRREKGERRKEKGEVGGKK